MNPSNSLLQVTAVEPVVAAEMPVTMGAPRLVVVIRGAEEEALLAGRIQELARARGLPVLLVGISRDSANEAEVRRNLVTIAAFLREGNTPGRLAGQRARTTSAPEIQIVCGRDWLRRIGALVKAGDMLACYSEETTGRLERPLSDMLLSGLNLPIYMFSGLRGERTRDQSLLSQAASWAGSLACIGGFLLLQARIVILIQGWLQSVLLLGALIAEVGTVWVVNSLANQI